MYRSCLSFSEPEAFHQRARTPKDTTAIIKKNNTNIFDTTARPCQEKETKLEEEQREKEEEQREKEEEEQREKEEEDEANDGDPEK